MFKHHGASRTFYHNFKLAILLSFVSGIVNVSGLFAFGVLTTNVTGHFAFFSEKLIFIDYKKASIFLMLEKNHADEKKIVKIIVATFIINYYQIKCLFFWY